MDFEQGYHEWNGKGESLMNKTKFITGSIGTKCLPSLLHISVFGMHQNLVFSPSASLLDTLLFVHTSQHQTDVWGQKVIHFVALERIHMMVIEKDQSSAMGIIVHIVFAVFLQFISYFNSYQIIKHWPHFHMIKDIMKKAL